MTSVLVLAITVYAGPYVGGPLFCGGFYDDTQPPWVAMPIETYGVEWECGDTIGIYADGEVRYFAALDAGPFGRFCVMQPDGTCPRIAVDVPKPHWWKGDDTSTVAVRAYNKTRLDRELAEGIWGWPR